MSGGLEAVLAGIGPVAVAVSGGVDSLTLASVARRGSARMVHAVSPAVPEEATRRVREEAARQGWDLAVIEAGEFGDPAYRRNPVNRCFFCKTNLYGAIRALTGRVIVSGANLDDLGEYRPGLEAAKAYGVRHPFVEAGMGKEAVRALARRLGLGAVAELPAAPCLSSRVETGIPIEPATLGFVHAVERLVSEVLGGAPGPRRAVRCRVRASGIVVELDPASLSALTADDRVALGLRIAGEAPVDLVGAEIRFAPYRVGSAFLTGSAR
ncbi:ATP-utilizing protein of the PP-loop superfamily-like protein [Methylobacterium sp. 4-46]|uniref:adenine nucleotide alpha hydrolase n=1 Tax=unclassified Methylobacterium TaxID=2615210 RepID=UPI000165C989|nr:MULTISPECIES: adenine nucleotide alpha hydrolase [Methylobacterium]ACA18178.1 ATP-utilizing protein of the PP-loop superfamily-like protein [Methylobacterium sp. 4-46]WFT77475.1 adenine nucleotide alpha hydrolase [Methylobacterium nodulans]